MKKKEAEKSIPLVVCDESGAFLFLSSTTGKGFRKSREQKALWLSSPDSDRLLPSGKEAALRVLEDRGDYYYCEVLVSGEAEAPDGSLDASPSDGQEPPVPDLGAADTAGAEDLIRLAELVARRRRELPRGSYTTLLFESGSQGIRKKIAQGMVELLLARDRDCVVREAADLLFHLAVLLEAEEVGLGPVLRELGRRAE